MNINNNFTIEFSYRGRPDIRISEESETYIYQNLNINIQNLGKDIKIINFSLEQGSDSPFTLKTHNYCDPSKEFRLHHKHYAYCTVFPIKSRENQKDRLTITISTLAGTIIKEMNFTLIKNTKFSNPKKNVVRRSKPRRRAEPYPTFKNFTVPTRQIFPERQIIRFQNFTVPTSDIFPERQIPHSQ